MIKGFTKENWKAKLARLPVEDAYLFDNRENIMVVADGVTRDPCMYLPKVNSLLGKVRWALKYPRPSPAREAAEISVKAGYSMMNSFPPHNRNPDAAEIALKQMNREIRQYGHKEFAFNDYLVNDFPGAVAALACIKEDSVVWGYICDCGVAVIDEKGNTKFRTEDEGPKLKDKGIWQDIRLSRFVKEKGKENAWINPSIRKIIRSEYRNNPDSPYSFGVLTGERSAEYFLKTGEEEIEPTDSVLVYTDGLEQVVFSGEFADKIRQKDFKGLEELCQSKVRTEGTLIMSNYLNYFL